MPGQLWPNPTPNIRRGSGLSLEKWGLGMPETDAVKTKRCAFLVKHFGFLLVHPSSGSQNSPHKTYCVNLCDWQTRILSIMVLEIHHLERKKCSCNAEALFKIARNVPQCLELPPLPFLRPLTSLTSARSSIAATFNLPLLFRPRSVCAKCANKNGWLGRCRHGIPATAGTPTGAQKRQKKTNLFYENMQCENSSENNSYEH